MEPSGLRLRFHVPQPCRRGGPHGPDSHWRLEMGLLFHTQYEKCVEAVGSKR